MSIRIVNNNKIANLVKKIGMPKTVRNRHLKNKRTKSRQNKKILNLKINKRIIRVVKTNSRKRKIRTTLKDSSIAMNLELKRNAISLLYRIFDYFTNTNYRIKYLFKYK
jgi:SOS-response transcriptional repressor LexA